MCDAWLEVRITSLGHLLKVFLTFINIRNSVFVRQLTTNQMSVRLTPLTNEI